MRHSQDTELLQHMTATRNLPPYPRLGECYRIFALALGTKASNRDVDRLARKGDFDWSLLSGLNDELIVAPIKKYVEPEFGDLVGQWLDHMHGSYLNLVTNVGLDSLNRTDALRLLIPNYFALHALGLIVGIHRVFGGPQLTRLFDSEKSPIAVVLEWLDEGEEIHLAKVAFPATTGSDRSDREMVQKWSRGTDLPELASIKKFADAVDQAGSVRKEKTLNLRRWLVVGRALAYLENASPQPFRGTMRRHLLLGMPAFNIQHQLSIAVIRTAEKYSALSTPALTLYEDLKRLTPKALGEQERTKRAIDDLELLTQEHDPDGNTLFHIAWIKGRWHVLAGKFDEALPHYEKAVELGSYRAGEMLKPILEESLALAAFLGKRPLLNRLKHQAIAAGLFSDPSDKASVENWEITQFSDQFLHLFPTHSRFQETIRHDEEIARLGFLAFDEEKIEEIKPDFGNPDRSRAVRSLDGEIRRWPQLRLFASFGKAAEVKNLLERGASVDQLDASGASALLCAMQYASQTGDRGALDLLLQKRHAKATLDSTTGRKQLTPLLCAIDYGEPDVVGKLLEMGATADHRGNIVAMTPLYYAIERFGAFRYPARLYRQLYDSLTAVPDLARQEVLRRYNVTLAGVYGDSRAIGAMMESPNYRAIFGKLVTAMVNEHVARHSEAKLLRIAELLLESKANPNAPHQYPAAGRTPLMLAAENNFGRAFDLMMRHQGDPYQTDAAGVSCATIAMNFRSTEIVGYLRAKGII
jgi:tetratricopeptide (TPR) repeat protein